MIRLAVSDVDGTLLPAGQSELDRSVTRAMCELTDSGVKVAIASGRSATSLERLFSSVSDRLYFICYDGALCLDTNGTVMSRPIDRDSLAVFFKYAKATLADAVFCGARSCYSLGGEAQRLFELDGESVQTVASIYDIKEPIYKVSVLGRADFAERETKTRRIDGSSVWNEFVSSEVNKGTALTYLQLKLGVSVFDTAVIGNSTGDIPMLKHAKLRASLPDAREDYAAAAQSKFSSAVGFFEFVKNQGRDH